MNPAWAWGRLRASPYGGTWLRGAALGLQCGAERWRLGLDEVVPYTGGRVDAWIQMEPPDLDAMTRGAPPPGRVGYRLADGDVPPRVAQARALFALASLGWCGPWPDPNATPDHDALLRGAAYDLAIGPEDAVMPMYTQPAPYGLHEVPLRVTDTFEARWVTTVGLSVVGACEVVARLSPRAHARSALKALRATALWCADTQTPPPRWIALPDGASHPCGPPETLPGTLPLATGMVPMWEIRVL